MNVTAFAALIKRKRGEARLTQETLALDVFGDSRRKADVSRLENAKIANPQEATVQKLCTALNISTAEMEPIRQSRLSAAQLDQIPTLSREELENLATRFQIEDVFDSDDAILRQLLTMKAKEFRELKVEVEAIPENIKRLTVLKQSAQSAMSLVDLDEVESLMKAVHKSELEEAAKSAEFRANNSLLRGDVEQAARLLNSAAESLAPIDPIEPVRRKVFEYNQLLKEHARKYGGDGMSKAIGMLEPIITDELKVADEKLWAAGKNTLAIALQNQGTRFDGSIGTHLLRKAVSAHQEALSVYTFADDPRNWSTAQNNLGNALSKQATRTAGKTGAKLIAKAVVAYRAALEAIVRSDYPIEWAMAQNNLGNALSNQGKRSEHGEAMDLLIEAIKAYDSSLEVLTQAEHPILWASTQNNVGVVLEEQGTRENDTNSSNLFSKAIDTYIDALAVLERADHPIDWAMTQYNLGNALLKKAQRTAGSEGGDLIAQAIMSYCAAIEVRTRSEHPVDWAETKVSLSEAFVTNAVHDSCSNPREALYAALRCIEGALEIYDSVHMRHDHIKATRLRADILAQIDALS